MNSLIKKLSEHPTYFIISFIGVILLGYNIQTSSLTPDGLSAINRSNYDSLMDVFKYSVVGDVHPPLIQILLYFWIKIVGNNVFLIKLPFLLMGISSIFLLFKLATKWFNRNVGLLSISFFVSIQSIVMYSQIIRPYISGLFLCLIAALYWTKIIEGKAKNQHYFFYALFGVMAAYNHYFSLLQIGVIGLVGLFFVNKKDIVKYLIVNTLIVVSFLPFLKTMRLQMSYDGISYLTKPTLSYIINYYEYVFQYSIAALIVVLIIIVYSAVNLKKLQAKKYVVITFLLFALPFIIGFTYSALVRPVMPFRSLIFSLPFFVLFIFSFSTKIKKPIVILFCAALLITNSSALIFTRNHYQLFNKGIVKNAISKTQKIIDEGESPFVIYNTPKFNTQFYQNNLNSNFNYFLVNEKETLPKDFRDKIKVLKNETVISYNIPHNLVSIIKEYYPYLKSYDYGFCSTFYSFSKIKSSKINNVIADTSVTFEILKSNISEKNLKLDSNLNNHYYHFNNNQEWGPSLSVPLGKFITDKYIVLESKISVSKSVEEVNGLLVLEIKNNDETLIWRSSDTKDWIRDSGDWQNIYFSVSLNGLIDEEDINENLKCKVYFWNQDKQEIAIDNISLKILKSNHLVYSLYEDFPVRE